MNGWIRLWIFVSSLWVFFVGTVVLFYGSWERLDESVPLPLFYLSDSARPFYEDLKPGETGPMFEREVSFEDGSKFKIRFPLLNDESIESIQSRVSKLAQEEGTEISESELGRFIALVRVSRELAARARDEYRQKQVKYLMESRQDRTEALWLSAAAAFAPPIAIFLLGSGVAWVIRGFRTDARN